MTNNNNPRQGHPQQPFSCSSVSSSSSSHPTTYLHLQPFPFPPSLRATLLIFLLALLVFLFYRNVELLFVLLVFVVVILDGVVDVVQEVLQRIGPDVVLERLADLTDAIFD